MTPDGIGVLAYQGGTVKFGASACQGFRPAPGLEVEVLAMAPHVLGGVRPSSIRMLTDDATYRQLMSSALSAFADEAPKVPDTVIEPPRALAVPTAKPLDLPELATPPPAGHRHVVVVRFTNKRDDLLFMRDVTLDGRLLRVKAFQAKATSPETPTNVFLNHATKWDTPEEARRQFDSEVATQTTSFEKRAHEVKTLPIAERTLRLASDEALEKAFLETNEKSAAHVLADWLQTQGDLRGELAAVYERKGVPGAMEFLERNEALLGEASHALGGELHTLKWTHGFVTGASLKRGGYDSRTNLATLTADFLASPLARFVTDLRLGLASFESDNDWSETLRAITESPRGPFIQKLEFDDYTYEDCEISWTAFGDFSPYWSKLPRLEHLHIRSGEGGVLGDIELPSLRTFIRESGGLAGDELRAILNAKWPKLERLDLWFGRDEYGGEGTVELIQPILDAKVPAGLKHLGVINCEFSDQLLPALLESKILPKLKTLDLSRGVLMDADVALILKHADKFKHLEHLDLFENLLDKSGPKLEAALPNVIFVGDQRYDGDEDRYCAVGE